MVPPWSSTKVENHEEAIEVSDQLRWSYNLPPRMFAQTAT